MLSVLRRADAHALRQVRLPPVRRQRQRLQGASSLHQSRCYTPASCSIHCTCTAPHDGMPLAQLEGPCHIVHLHTVPIFPRTHVHTQGTKCADKAWPQSQGGACKSGLKCYRISCAYWQCDTHQPPKEPKGERESVSRRRALPAIGITHCAASCASYP